jgi:hypothetical protein
MNRKKYLAVIIVAAVAVALSILACTMTGKHPPVVTRLEAEAECTFPAGSLEVTCEASDPNGDDLSYEWTASGGHIEGTGPEVTWIAPEEVGTYDITVVVNDGHGGSATETLRVSVVTVQPPVIKGLLVTADHKYLKQTSSGYLVGEGKDFQIECTASHPDDLQLSYKWECQGGEILGISKDGSRITWRAPYTRGELMLTVTVSDMYGNMVSQSVALEVVSCSTFG